MRKPKRKGKKSQGRRSKKKSFHKKKQRANQKYYTKQEIFLSRMASILMMDPRKVKTIFSQRISTVIRLNPLADKPEKILKVLQKSNLELTEVKWAPHTYIVENKDKSELGEMKEYKRGLFYIQNLSSMIPAIELEAEEGEKILDMCAAPGSKTTMISALTNNKAEVVANEEDFRRLGKLQNVLRQFHSKAKIAQSDGRIIGKERPDYFDRVLLDAPCSGEGLIYLKGEKPLRFWSIKKVKVMRKLQEDLILSAFDALKPGGTLVYSTCTLEPEENEGVVSFLLNIRPSASLEQIKTTSSERFDDFRESLKPGITKWSGHSFNPQVKQTIRILPSENMQGFYVAKIIKNK